MPVGLCEPAFREGHCSENEDDRRERPHIGEHRDRTSRAGCRGTPVENGCRKGGKREKHVVPPERVGHAAGEVGQIARQPVAAQGNGRVVSPEIHQVGYQQAVQQEHEGGFRFPHPEEGVRGKQDERGYQLGGIALYRGEGGERGGDAPQDVECDELQENSHSECEYGLINLCHDEVQVYVRVQRYNIFSLNRPAMRINAPEPLPEGCLHR